jgi:hypothetical protein
VLVAAGLALDGVVVREMMLVADVAS